MEKEKPKNKLCVTRPVIPAVNEILPFVNEIFRSGYVTNFGPVCNQLEKELGKYLKVDFISLFSSGTLALTLAIKALNLKGEVITTPFTHISTIQALFWNNLKPVFVDIDQHTLTISGEAIEQAVGPETCAILPVHIFGIPCDIERIGQIAKKNKLKLIYDAAHCFGVELNGESICNFGDLSVLSFHATKVFNTIEGGAVVCRDEKMKKYLDALSNSGVDGNNKVIGNGLNAKMNELQAAFGLANLKHIDDAIQIRKWATSVYRELLSPIEGIKFIEDKANVNCIYSYFPMLVEKEKYGAGVKELIGRLNHHNIYPKRYFYPLVNKNNSIENYGSYPLNVAESVSENIICLPLSHKLKLSEIEFIAGIIQQLHNQKMRKRYCTCKVLT